MLYIMCMRSMLYKYTWNIYILYMLNTTKIPGPWTIGHWRMDELVGYGGKLPSIRSTRGKGGAQCMVIGHFWENICFTNFFHFSRLHSQRKCRYLLKCSFIYYIRLLTSTNAGFFRMFRIFMKISKNINLDTVRYVPEISWWEGLCQEPTHWYFLCGQLMITRSAQKSSRITQSLYLGNKIKREVLPHTHTVRLVKRSVL